MKIFAIGDIHGCRNELEKLLEITDRYAKPEDRYVFVGDYVDRGPDSKGVLDLLISRRDGHSTPHVFLKGNHEDMMLKGEYWGMNGGRETMISYGLDGNMAYEYPRYYLELLPHSHVAFLKNLQYFYKVDRTVVVHAGLFPHWPIEQQKREFMLWDRTYYGYEGVYFNNYRVIVGHTPRYLEVKDFGNQLAIDTCCVFGGRLSCVAVDSESGELLNTFQVKSGFEY